jgi:uncharacterized membrane protein YuzA (DUF378 family)
MGVMDIFKQDELYYKKLAYKVAVLFIIAGAVNWLLIGIFQYNLVQNIFGAKFGRVVYVIVGLCVLMVMFNRDTYLPFLGESVAPCSAFPDRVPPGATKEVVVMVRPGAKVIYWASEPAMEGLKAVVDWKKAYSEFENAGMVTADMQGQARLMIRPPQAYNVPLGGRLEPHVHYRVCEPKGWMGRVQTKFLSNDGFIDFNIGTMMSGMMASGSSFAPVGFSGSL